MNSMLMTHFSFLNIHLFSEQIALLPTPQLMFFQDFVTHIFELSLNVVWWHTHCHSGYELLALM